MRNIFWALSIFKKILLQFLSVNCIHNNSWIIKLYFNSRLEVKVLVTQSVWLFVTPWTITHQTPLSMVFSRQEYWRGLPFPSAGDLPDPGIEPRYPALQADSLPSEPPGNPWLTYQLSYQILFFLWWPIRIISKIFILGDFLNWGIIDIQHYISFSYTT